MTELSEKARAYDLYACLTNVCSVVTFIQLERCPVCQQPGAIIRSADIFEKGPPPDSARGGSLEPGEGAS
jgi:hypothetical protein